MTQYLAAPNAGVTGQPPKLLDQMFQTAKGFGHTEEMARRMAEWYRRYVFFHGKRHPNEMGLAEVARFLEHVATTDKDALRAIAAARSALEFLYAKAPMPGTASIAATAKITNARHLPPRR